MRGRLSRHRLVSIPRRSPIPHGWCIEHHADDYIQAIERSAASPVVLECVSAGGPIGQIVATRRPDLVRGLILTGSFHRVPARTRERLISWIHLARRREWAALQWTLTEATLRPDTVSRVRLLKPLLRLVPPPREPHRFERIIESILDVDTSALLPRIQCPTLVIAGTEDRLFGPEVQREMVARIPGSSLKLIAGQAHGINIEYRPYHDLVVQFIRSLR